jgi:hypothetical protein
MLTAFNEWAFIKASLAINPPKSKASNFLIQFGYGSFLLGLSHAIYAWLNSGEQTGCVAMQQYIRLIQQTAL